jgi:hypothetical protein
LNCQSGEHLFHTELDGKEAGMLSRTRKLDRSSRLDRQF